jgi:xylitol oxidase
MIETGKRTNWAGNLTYGTERLYLPKTIAEAQEIVRRLDRVRPLGSRHCFNTIADSPEPQISLQNLNQIVSLDMASNRVTVEAGIRYGDLAPYLHENGFALHNLASLPHISIIGACATATHGSGMSNGNLATAVSALEFINAKGDLVRLSREADGYMFAGAVVGLGSLGVITRLTLDVLPTFNMMQHVYLDLPLTALDEHFDEIMSRGYSVSLFTDWQGDTVNQVWVKRKMEGDGTVEAESSFYGAEPARTNVHPILDMSPVNCTEQMGVVGPWYERLPHFRMDFTPSSGTELQSEYFVAREHAPKVARIIQRLGPQLAPVLLTSEVRMIAADDLWMSPNYNRSSVAFHFTLKQDWDTIQHLLPIIEKELEPFEARPHWGKMFTMPPYRLQDRYERLSDFQALAQEYDPAGKFRNAFLDENVLGCMDK